jgi:hypothetical protein
MAAFYKKCELFSTTWFDPRHAAGVDMTRLWLGVYPMLMGDVSQAALPDPFAGH